MSKLILNTKPVEAPSPVKYCLYARKSTESDEQQALSVEVDQL